MTVRICSVCVINPNRGPFIAPVCLRKTNLGQHTSDLLVDVNTIDLDRWVMIDLLNVGAPAYNDHFDHGFVFSMLFFDDRLLKTNNHTSVTEVSPTNKMSRSARNSPGQTGEPTLPLYVM